MTIRRLVLALPVLGLGWLGVLVGVGLFSDAAPASVVVLPSRHFLATLPPDFAVIEQGARTITLTSEAPGAARRLYASGAFLVLPAGLPGCLPLRRNPPPG